MELRSSNHQFADGNFGLLKLRHSGLRRRLSILCAQFIYVICLSEPAPVDLVGAAKYFTLAADQNHPNAQLLYRICLSEARR
jgi:hypothetical protein